MRRAGGFDLVLGNPPWIKVEWRSGDVLADHEPRFALRKMTAPQLARAARGDLRSHPGPATGPGRDEFEEAEGTQNFLNAQVNYPPCAAGQKANLYKCFLPRAWASGSEQGCQRLPASRKASTTIRRVGRLRRELYSVAGAFSVHQRALSFSPRSTITRYESVNVYGPSSPVPRFLSFVQRVPPSQQSICALRGESEGVVPGIKEEIESRMGR
jgi:hypothetical protein